MSETEIILGIQAIEDDLELPPTSNTPKFLRIYALTAAGPLDVRLSVAAFPELKAALAKYSQARDSP